MNEAHGAEWMGWMQTAIINNFPSASQITPLYGSLITGESQNYNTYKLYGKDSLFSLHNIKSEHPLAAALLPMLSHPKICLHYGKQHIWIIMWFSTSIWYTEHFNCFLILCTQTSHEINPHFLVHPTISITTLSFASNSRWAMTIPLGRWLKLQLSLRVVPSRFILIRLSHPNLIFLHFQQINISLFFKLNTHRS